MTNAVCEWCGQHYGLVELRGGTLLCLVCADQERELRASLEAD